MDGARVDHIVFGKNYNNIIKKSAFFSRVVAYAPYTIGAMHAIFSGTYGTKTGVNSYWSNVNFKKDKYKTITKYLKDEEYLTYGDTINKLVLPPVGFDELVIHDELNDNLTERHLALIDKFNNLSKEGKKFFLYLHYSNIHTGIMQEVLKKYDNFSKEYFANRERNEQFYKKLFDAADEYLGKLFTHVEKLGLAKNTLIVIVSDHGISVGEKFGERAYGVFCYDYTLTATAIFCHPDIHPTSISNQVRSIDILPTILEILNIKTDPKYEKFQGESLIPFINGSGISKIAFSQSGNPLETGKPPKQPNVWAVRTNEWKFIRNIHNGTEELYSLKDDPREENNVISRFPQKAAELRIQLDQISSDT
jgi:arylsulfatase A-like enzyme